MCDYSLRHLASRPATTEDKLIVSRFRNSISKGFASINPEETNVAICVLPGTELAFEYDITEKSTYSTELVHDCKVGRFVQINKETPHTHHDALELPNGTVVLLNNLQEGQRASVLQLPAAPRTEAEAQTQKRLDVVA